MYDSSQSTHQAASSGVSAELRRFAPHYGYVVADNAVFTHGLISAVVDHVVIDRYGILIIDAESHEGASVLGTDTDATWTATFPNGSVAEFRNPLHLNRGNENVVKEALGDLGVRLESNEIRSAVVFSGADISRLSLVEVSALKVKSTEDIADIFETRYNFPPNNGRLTAADIDQITSMIDTFSEAMPVDEAVPGSWQSDPAVVASTAAALAVSPPRAFDAEHYRAPGQLAGHHSGAPEGPSLRAALLTLGTIFVIILIVAAGFVFFAQLQSGSVAAWTAALVLLVALSELVAANLSASRGVDASSRVGRGAAVGFVARALAVFAIVAVGWVFIAGGGAERIGANLAAQFEPAAQLVSLPVNPPKTRGVIVAKRRLKEQAPGIYKAIADLNSPTIVPDEVGNTSYTWDYIAAGSSVPTSITLTLDGGGNVVKPEK